MSNELITITKKVTMTWGSESEATTIPSNNTIGRLRLKILTNLIARKKTTHRLDRIDDVTSSRFFVDQDSAQEWKDFMITFAAESGYTVTVTIEDITSFDSPIGIDPNNTYDIWGNFYTSIKDAGWIDAPTENYFDSMPALIRQEIIDRGYVFGYGYDSDSAKHKFKQSAPT